MNEGGREGGVRIGTIKRLGTNVLILAQKNGRISYSFKILFLVFLVNNDQNVIFMFQTIRYSHFDYHLVHLFIHDDDDYEKYYIHKHLCNTKNSIKQSMYCLRLALTTCQRLIWNGLQTIIHLSFSTNFIH